MLQIEKSTTCQGVTVFAPYASDAATSSQQFGANVSFNERYKPYKPKFHKVCSVPPDGQNPENMLLEVSDPRNLGPIDYSKKPYIPLQQQVQMASSDAEPLVSHELEPLNLSKTDIQTNRKKLPTVEPLHGISSTSNSQNIAYLDEPIASPGPFLGKTRLVGDYQGRGTSSQPNRTVNNNSDKLNYMGISSGNGQGLLQNEENLIDMNSQIVGKTNEHLPMTKTKDDEMTKNSQNQEIIQLFPKITSNAIDLNIISSTSELVEHRVVVDPVKLVPSPVDLVSMQIAEVSSSVNTSLIPSNEPPSRNTQPIGRKSKNAVNIASEYIELTNK